MITHLPMIAVVFPANVLSFLKVLLPITQFDFLDPEWTTKYIYEFDEDEHEKRKEDSLLFDQLDDLGYESFNWILNMGSIYLFFVYYHLKALIVFAVLYPLRKYNKYINKAYNYYLTDLLFYQILTIMIDGYLEIIISCYLSFKESIMTVSGESISFYTGIYVVFIALVLLPIIMIWTLVQSKDKIASEQFQYRWGRVF
jgi:hypothetical protein